jgi:hypothetical protein
MFRFTAVVFSGALATPPPRFPADHIRGDLFTVNVTLGTSAQSQDFSLLVSLGDTLTWVPSVTCPNCGDAVHIFDPSKSSTHSSDGRPFAVDMKDEGLDSVKGVMAEDVLEIAGSGLKTKTSFGEVTDGRFFDFTSGFDGVLGFGFGEATSGERTFLQNLVDDGLIDAPVVSMYFPPQSNATMDHDASGILTLGGVDTELFVDGTLNYVDVTPSNSRNPWTVALSRSLDLNGEVFATAAAGVEISTGSLYSIAPDADVESIARGIGAYGSIQGNYLVPQDVKFTLKIPLVDNQRNVMTVVTLTEKDLVVDSVFDGFGLLLLVPQSVVGRPVDANWVFGTEILKTIYLVLDSTEGRHQVGIAEPSGIVPVAKPGRLPLTRSSLVSGAAAAAAVVV